MGKLSPSGTGNHEAAGAQCVTGSFQNRIFFACDQRFVYIQCACAQNPVGAELVTGGKFYDIIPNKQIRTDPHHLACADGL